MRVLKLLAAVLLVAVLGVGGYLAVTVKLVSWRPLVKAGPAGPLLITNVRVFTATDAGVLDAQDVLVEEGKVVRVAPTSSDAARPGRVLDGTGKTLLPGLIDAHVHLFNTAAPPWYLALPEGRHNLEAYLYAGVTSVVSMGDDSAQMASALAGLQRGDFAGPRIARAGSPITRTGGHPQASRDALVPALLWPGVPKFAEQIDRPEDADGAVERQVAGGASFVKMVVDDLPGGMPRLEEAHLRAVVEAAHRRGVKAVAHVGTASDALLAAKVGVDALNHMPNRGPMTAEDVAALKQAGIPVVATMIIFERSAQLSDRHYTFGDLDRAIEAPEILEQLGDAACERHHPHPFLGPWLAQMADSRSHRKASVAAMQAAGVPLLVGTDSSIIGNIAGASMHHELKLLVDSGVPPEDALLGATVRAARFFFPKERLGVVEAGAVADLLLVDGNPLEDITATARINAVVQGGRVVERLVK